MSIIKTIKSVFGIKSGAAAQAVQTFVITEAQKAVAALKKTSIGQAVAADIASLANARLTGPEKFEQVVANTAPLIVSMLATGGAAAAIADVEDVARALVQDVFNDTRSTKAGAIVKLLLQLLKL